MGLPEDLIAACEPFVGDKAEKFLSKTCRTMLGHDLADIQMQELDSLAYWVRVGGLRLIPAGEVDKMVEAIHKVKGMKG